MRSLRTGARELTSTCSWSMSASSWWSCLSFFWRASVDRPLPTSLSRNLSFLGDGWPAVRVVATIGEGEETGAGAW